MDQTFLAGLGNVYAQEVCFYARVNPTRIVSTLSDREICEIYNGIKKILKAAISHKGSSVDTYLDICGLKGKYIPFLKVYNREGETCLRCGGKIKKVQLGGRGTCFCANCQR
jgi:formamidopyrimidine-DNA glycosylase